VRDILIWELLEEAGYIAEVKPSSPAAANWEAVPTSSSGDASLAAISLSHAHLSHNLVDLGVGKALAREILVDIF